MHKRPAVVGVVGALCVALLLVVAPELAAQTPSLPTQAQLHKHFHNDARLAWAVTAADVQFTGLGYAGSGPQQQKDSAPPGNYAKFLAIVDKWLEIGFPCKP